MLNQEDRRKNHRTQHFRGFHLSLVTCGTDRIYYMILQTPKIDEFNTEEVCDDPTRRHHLV